MKHSEKQKRADMLKCLMADRCANYGYDWRMFRRVSNQRSRARAAVRQALFSCEPWELAWNCPLAYRINWERLEYVTGQSSNEEITNLLRQLVNPEARWVS